MTTIEYIKAKNTIVSACNATGLAPADLSGVLSAVLAEAREQMAFELTGNIVELEHRLADMNKEEDVNDE